VEIILFGILIQSYLGPLYPAVKMIRVADSLGAKQPPPSGTEPWTPLNVVPGVILNELHTINSNYTEGLHELDVPGCPGEYIVHGCA
jgi:hypothetical protein